MFQSKLVSVELTIVMRNISKLSNMERVITIVKNPSENKIKHNLQKHTKM